MSSPAITTSPDTPMQEALSLMREKNVRRLPVIDSSGKLVGIVSERDILQASPSGAISLDVWELTYLLSKITIQKIMEVVVLTIPGDTPIEEAARIMADNFVGALPVVDGGNIVGMITETDIFKTLVDFLGAREPGIRFTVVVPAIAGELAKLSQAIYAAGGNIIAAGAFDSERKEYGEITFRVEGVEPEALRAAIEPLVKSIVDFREVS
jgi:acetoin utilization protein AcuB